MVYFYSSIIISKIIYYTKTSVKASLYLKLGRTWSVVIKFRFKYLLLNNLKFIETLINKNLMIETLTTLLKALVLFYEW